MAVRRDRILGAVTALLFVAMASHAAPLDPVIPVIQFCFDEASFKSVLAQWGPSGVVRFNWHFAIDFPFLVSYGFFGYRVSRHSPLTSGLPTLMKSSLTWALPAAAALDAGENVLHLVFVHEVPAIPAMLYFVAGLVATFKWMLIAAFGLGIGYAWLRRVG